MKRRPQKTPTHTAGEPIAFTAFRQLVRIEGLIRRLSEPHFARLGTSPAHWGVLRTLSRLKEQGQPNPRMNELGQALLVQPPSLSATLDRMSRAGLILRRDDPADQRTRRVSMTAAGRAVLTGARAAHDHWRRTLMAGLSPVDMQRLGRLLDKLSQHMDTVARGPDSVLRPAATPASPRNQSSQRTRPRSPSPRTRARRAS